MSDIQDLAATLHAVAVPGMKPKALIAAVREQHPDATKKAIVRAAFFALTQGTDEEGERAAHLHAFALSERAADEVEAPKKLRERDRHKEQVAQRSTH